MSRKLACRDFLAADALLPDDAVEGAELERLFWTIKQREKELARRERYWASVNDALTQSYEELEQLRQELLRLNDGLEKRVADQVGEIVEHAARVEALNVQLQARVRDRSRELQAALRRLGHGDQVSSLPRGTVVGNRARIVRKIGEGGMGSVYEAEDLLTSRSIALKMLRSTDARALRSFVAEAEAASAVAHPAIVRTLHIDVSEEGVIYQLMELVRGVTLAVRVRAGALPLPEAARVGAVVASALAAAHAHGVIHRDIKPENILLSAGAPGIRVLDFGIAKLTFGESETLPHALVGTPAYMSPDQIRSPGSATPATDVYSLGVVLYELVSGRRPFAADSAGAMLHAHLHSSAPPLDLPAPLSELIFACLEKEPAKRPKAEVAAAALDAFADDHAGPSGEEIGRLASSLSMATDATEYSGAQ